MTVSLWSLTIFLVASLAVLFALTYSAKSRSRAVARLSQSVGLAVPDEHRDALAARAARRSRASVLGAFFGTALVVLGFLSGVIPSSEANGDPVDIWVLLGGYFVGLAVGAMINALTFHNPVPHGSRIARSGAVDLGDYLAPVDLVGARVSVAIGVIVLGVAVALFAMGAVPLNPLLSVSALVIGLAVISLIIFEVGARRIINRAQPVGSQTELAWDDALRSSNIREVATAPICLGLWGALAVLISLINQPIPQNLGGNLLFVALLLGFFALITLAVVAAAISLSSRPQQHYLLRLWPEVATGLALSRMAK